MLTFPKVTHACCFCEPCGRVYLCRVSALCLFIYSIFKETPQGGPEEPASLGRSGNEGGRLCLNLALLMVIVCIPCWGVIDLGRLKHIPAFSWYYKQWEHAFLAAKNLEKQKMAGLEAQKRPLMLAALNGLSVARAQGGRRVARCHPSSHGREGKRWAHKHFDSFSVVLGFYFSPSRYSARRCVGLQFILQLED